MINIVMSLMTGVLSILQLMVRLNMCRRRARSNKWVVHGRGN